MMRALTDGSTLSALQWAEDRLAGRVPSPRAEAEQLVAFVGGLRRTEMFAREAALSSQDLQRLSCLLERRVAGEPFHYLTGSRAFRAIELEVGPGVLVPRPETEFVVEVAGELLDGPSSPVVVEIGTGSGAISLSIALEWGAAVWATDSSEAALVWARRNLQRYPSADVTLLRGDLFEPLPRDLRGHLDLVVSNPPYLSEDDLERAPDDVRWFEPREATLSGATGAEVSERLAHEALEWLRPGGWLVVETWTGVWPRLRDAMTPGYEEVGYRRDLAGAIRVAVGRRP